MKLATIGSRELKYNTNFGEKTVRNFLLRYMEKYKDKITKVISGGAIGTDQIAEEVANRFKLSIEIIRPVNPQLKKSLSL